MASQQDSPNKSSLYASLAIGIVSVGAYVLFRPSRRCLQVKAVVPRNSKRVFEMHLDPAKFYSVLKYTKDNLNKHYEVLNYKRSGNKIEYTLSHVVDTAFGKKDIRSNPLRFNIDEENNRFEETFTVLKTTFLLQYKFIEPPSDEFPDKSNVCKIEMNIVLTGPYLLVSFFTRVKSDFENRFRITNDNINELLP
jgi:hypothetical protein